MTRRHRLLAGVVVLGATCTFGSAAAQTSHPGPACGVAPGAITTIAGTPGFVADGDGGPASEATLTSPVRLAFDPIRGPGPQSHALYIMEHQDDQTGHEILPGRVRRVDWVGRIETVAGPATPSDGKTVPPWDQPNFAFDGTVGLTFDSEGNMYLGGGVGDSDVLLRIATGGSVERIAGSGVPDFSGDGGPATEAAIHWIGDILVDDTGVIVFDDHANERIRRIDEAGTITTIVGPGEQGTVGDGETGEDVWLSGPWGLAFAPDGGLLFGDGLNRVRRMDDQGIVTTAVGDGTPGYSGDGGAATAAQINAAEGISVNSAGNLYIADTGNHVIRRVDQSGTITTVAGNGDAGFGGDGGPATQARLFEPTHALVGPDGALYIADFSNNRVRKVCPPF